jgi:hypothetical protein
MVEKLHRRVQDSKGVEAASAIGHLRIASIHIPGGRIEMHDEVVQDRGGAFSVETDVGEKLSIQNDIYGVAASENLGNNPGSRTVELAGKAVGFVRREETAFVTASRLGERHINVFPPETETIEDRQGHGLICRDVRPAEQRAPPPEKP